MDPNANLKEQRDLAKEILDMKEVTDTDDIFRLQDRANQLSALVLGLDRWISRGGFLPTEWRKE